MDIATARAKLTGCRLVMIDNYDSFTFNLIQYFAELGLDATILRNDEIAADEVLKLPADFVVLSPGPSAPAQAGICLELIRKCIDAKRPLLGICLGHQAIGEALGGKVIRADVPVHGKTSAIHHDGTGVFVGIPPQFSATRYHSLVIEKSSLPVNLRISASTADGTIMGIRHRSMQLEGVQFHPESVLTEYGHQMLANFALECR